jgi:hypothetical protein
LPVSKGELQKGIAHHGEQKTRKTSLPYGKVWKKKRMKGKDGTYSLPSENAFDLVQDVFLSVT